MFNYVCVLCACISAIYTVIFVHFCDIKFVYKLCNVAYYIQYSCLLGLLAPDTGCLSAYVKEPLVLGGGERFKPREV